MEITSKFVPHANVVSSYSTTFHSKSSLLVSSSVVPFHHSSKSKALLTLLQGLRINAKKHRNFGATYASEADIISTDLVSETWLLEPVGDGDTRHIGLKVEMPSAFEIASSEVTVGRLPDKADMVIPVATVSGIHARIQKKEGKLLVTDLDSTNGTFVDDKRLRPGVVAAVSAGSRITFGDTHLAVFRVSKLEKAETASKQEVSEDQSDSPSLSTETS